MTSQPIAVVTTIIVTWMHWSTHVVTLGATSLRDTCIAIANGMTYIASWMYYITITRPLRAFYFEGPIWGNVLPEQVCSLLTNGVPSDWWNKTDDRMVECQRLLNTKYHSFEVTIMCVLYFATLGFAALYVICRCCFLRPIITEIRKITHVK